MNTTYLARTIAASCIAGTALLFGGTAQADSFRISIGTPSVSVGYSSGHHRPRAHHRAKFRHHRQHVRHYAKPYRAPRHQCHYESRPVTVRYYDDCGRARYYTHYERVRVCRTGHGHY